VPPEIDRVVARALAKEPDHRYQNARSFAAALKRILEGKPPEDSNEEVGHASVPPQAAPKAMAQGNEAEMEFWRAIKDSDDPEELELYIEQFPQGVYVELARRKIAELGG
jgi:serine/threonine-protein kinase